MARAPFRASVSTSGDSWTTIVSGARTITSVLIASNTFSDAKVGLRVLKGSTATILVPDQLLPEAASYRFRVGALHLEAGDSLQGKSAGSVDWTVAGETL